MPWTRRNIVLGGLALLGAGAVQKPAFAAASSNFAGTAVDNGVTFQKTNFAKIDKKWHRQVVKYFSSEPIGTVVVDTRHHFLYVIMVEVFRRNADMVEVIRAFAILSAESLMKDHPAKGWFLDRATQLQNDIAATFEEAVADGSIDGKIDGRAIAAELIAVMDGLQMLWLRDPTRFDMCPSEAMVSAVINARSAWRCLRLTPLCDVSVARCSSR